MSMRESKPQSAPSDPPAGSQLCYSSSPLAWGKCDDLRVGRSSIAKNFALQLEAQLFGESEY